MKKLLTVCFLLATALTVNAQDLTKEDAINVIKKNLTGLEYYYPVVGEMGFEKIASVEVDEKGMFRVKNKDGKKLFFFGTNVATMEYDSGRLIIWHNYYMMKLDIKEARANKIITAFNQLKSMF